MSIILPIALSGQAREDRSGQVPEGVYIKLTNDFYEQLSRQGQNNHKVYSNDPSEGALKEIAVSTRFMVETNLQILKQQEIVIQLLQDILDKQR